MVDKATLESAVSRIRGEVAYLLPLRNEEEGKRVEDIREARLAIIHVLREMDEFDYNDPDLLKDSLKEALESLSISETEEELNNILEIALDEINKAEAAVSSDFRM